MAKKISIEPTTGKAELNTASATPSERDCTDSCFCRAKSLAHKAKARFSLPATRSLAMPLINSSSRPERRPDTFSSFRWIRTWKKPRPTVVAIPTAVIRTANRASGGL